MRFLLGSRAANRSSGNLEDLASKLARSIHRTGPDYWDASQDDSTTDPRAEAANPEDNYLIPSGYTYLLQFIAHDLVASVVSQSVNRGAVPEIQNARARGLMLDTLYGDGPDLQASVYEFSERHHEKQGHIPRTGLRVGLKRAPLDAQDLFCLNRDIGRGIASFTTDEGRETDDEKKWATEAFVADSRNDSHALISQTTVLFHYLHNYLEMFFRKAVPTHARWSNVELAYRQYLAARLIVTVLYRDIIKRDVLKRILHKDIYELYMDPAKSPPFLGRTRSFPEIPFEFSHGAFRFAHSMVRDQYDINSNSTGRQAEAALRQSSLRHPEAMPVDQAWIIDWSLFFEVSQRQPNYSRRIGPNFATFLRGGDIFSGIRGQTEDEGLVFRDILSALYTEMPSVSEIIAEFGNTCVNIPEYESTWKNLIKEWLEDHQSSGGYEPPLSAEQIGSISENPPIPFFTLLEAAYTIENGIPVRKGGGLRLGHFASSIIAETFWGAFLHNPLKASPPGKAIIELDDLEISLEDRIGAVCATLLGDSDLLTDTDAQLLTSISSMRRLLEVMDGLSVFDEQQGQ